MQSSRSTLIAVVLLVAPLVTCASSNDRIFSSRGGSAMADPATALLPEAGASVGTLLSANVTEPRLSGPPAADPEPGPADAHSCPSGMSLVSGSYCPEVEQVCKRWLDPPGQYHTFRCAEYVKPSVCKAKRRLMHFCIDTDEQGAVASSGVPQNHVSFVAARVACESRGARVCAESEWNFACEGEEMRPYPYGFKRDAKACNIDRTDLGFPNGGLHDRRTAVGSNPKCVSPFGVRDLAGNLEEWVARDQAGTSKWTKATLLKGSWWLPGKSTCRAANAGHDAVYHGTETGYRCCL